MKQLLVSLLLLTSAVFAQQTATTSTPLEPGQIYFSGNLVQPTTTTSGSTWTNAVYQDNLTCWAWGNSGYCGPNPIVRPGNNINFSYGWTDIYQQVQLATASALSVPGLRINGYNFGFTAKNGNGWDDGRTDLLFAYVQFNDAQGGTLLNHTHNLSYKFDWSRFDYNKTFDSPYELKDISTVRYGFVGQDNNGWAGPYGPEINSVSFGVKYSIDPCVKDPLYSPTCSGYLEALNKLLPPPMTIEPMAATAPVVSEPVGTIAPTAAVSTELAVQTTVIAPVVSAPAPAPTTSTVNVTGTASSSGSTTVGAQSNRESSSSGSNSLALSIISRNQERDAAGAAVAQSAVSQAQAAANLAQQEAVSVAANAAANSSSTNAVTINNAQSSSASSRSNNNSTGSTNFSLQPGQSTMINITALQTGAGMIGQQQNSIASVAASTSAQPTTTTVVNTQQSVGPTNGSFVLPLLPPQQPTNVAVSSNTSTQIEQTQVQTASPTSVNTQSTDTYSMLTPNLLTDRTNPLNDIVENRQTLFQSSNTATAGPAVNSNASDNEAAGGLSINRMALAPTGYSDYLNFTLKDAAFYAPREVYRNQRTVDNARALRQLTNDSRHRDMVEQQYKRN